MGILEAKNLRAGYGGGDIVRDIDLNIAKGEFACILGPNGMRAVVEILEDAQASPENPVNLVLCQGLLKGNKMDLVVQKATELGVSGIHLLVTERSVVRHTRKVPRWRKIAEEAVEQCGGATVPPVYEPRELSSFLAERCPLAGIILWEEAGLPLPEALAQLILSQPSPRLDGVSADLALIVGDVVYPPADDASYDPRFFAPYRALLPRGSGRPGPASCFRQSSTSRILPTRGNWRRISGSCRG